MGKANKLIKRFLRRPKDFTFDELITLLMGFGFVLSASGAASGSAVKFVNHTNGHVIRLHKPHPRPEIKPYLINIIINELKKGGYINEK
ncbi:MAG: type II toxin-antitoxin system HicA family toxin [Defluviitaleaceae bacterium]|nr:type II toxin-antitoxin system HicA family toxin [Defluviitaleaceae bacterium]